MDKGKIELRVGILSITGVVLLVLGTMWGKDVSIASKYREYYFAFENSAGLRPGDPATVNGVKKGIVEAVELDAGTVLIKVSLDEHVRLFSDVRARIGVVDLMGGHSLDISQGSSGVPASGGARENPLPGAEAVSIGQMFAEAYAMKSKVDTLLETLQHSTDELSAFMDPRKFRAPIHKSIEEMAAVSSELRDLLQTTKPVMQRTLTTLDRTATEFNTLLMGNKDDLQQDMEAFTRITAKLDTFTTVIKDIALLMQRRDGTFARLIYDDEIYTRLQSAVNGVDSLTIELRTNLGRYLNGVDIKLLNLIDF